jgi:hypothetical protein
MALIGAKGTIYFIACEEVYIKIGFAGRRGVAKRISQMHTHNPFKLDLIRTITPAYILQEKWLHEYFENLRALTVGKEWFYFSEEMLTITPPDSETLLAEMTAREKYSVSMAYYANATPHSIRQWIPRNPRQRRPKPSPAIIARLRYPV